MKVILTKNLTSIFLSFLVLFVSSCVQDKMELQGGKFDLEGFEFDVLAPQIRLATSSAPYENSSSPKLILDTGADKINCASFTHIGVSETATRPPVSEFTLTCRNSGTQTVILPLQDLTQGGRKLYFWGYNQEQQTYSEPLEVDMILDQTNPTGTITSTSASFLKGGSTGTLALTMNDNIGLSHYQLSLTTDGGVTWSTLGNFNPNVLYPSFAIPFTDTNQASVRVTYFDRATNSFQVSTGSLIIDSTPPTVAITDLANYIAGGSTQTVTYSTSDSNGIQRIELQYSTDGTNFVTADSNLSASPYSWIVPMTETANGVLRIRSVDNAGNDSYTQTLPFIVDSTAPTVTVSPLPSVLAGGNTQTLNFSVTDASPLQDTVVSYTTDGGSTFTQIATVPSGTTSVSWSIPFVDTTNSFVRVTGTDQAGNVTNTDSNTFILDASPPTATISNLASYVRGGIAQNIVFTASDTNGVSDITLSFSNNGGTNYTTIVSNASLTSPYSYTIPALDITNGRLRLSVTDTAGNTSIAQTATFGIDSTAPTATLASLSSSLLRGGNTEAISFTYSDDVADGSHQLFYAGDGVNFSSIQLNPTSPHTWTIPLVNLNTAKVRLVVTDHVGNTAQDESAAFTIDSTDPTISLNDLAFYLQGGSTENVVFSGSDANGLASLVLEYAADGATYSTTLFSNTAESSPFAWTVPSTDNAGATLRLTATDNAGNTDSIVTTAFTVDSTAPAITLDDFAAHIRGNVTNTINNTRSDNFVIASEELLYAEDGVNFVSLTTSPVDSYAWATPNVEAPNALIRLVVTDQAGNSSTLTTASFVIDSTAPTGSISNPSDPIRGGSTYSVALTAADNNTVNTVSLEYAEDGTNFSNVLSTTQAASYSWTIPTVDSTGSKLRYVVTDLAGNQSIFESSAFNIDSTPSAAPTLSLTSPVYTNSTAVTFTAGACGDVAAILINEGAQPARTDAAWQTCSTGANAITYTLPTSEGPHTLRAWSKDSVGNVSLTSTDFSVTYDVTNPVIAVTTPSIMRGGANYTLNWTLTETYINTTEDFTVEYYNGSSWQSVGTVNVSNGPHTTQAFSTSFTPPGLSITNARIRVSVSDLAGNSATTQSGTFTIDSTPPTGSISNPPSPILGGSTYNISLSAADNIAVSTVSLQYAANGTNFSTVLSTTQAASYSWTVPTSNTTGSRIRYVVTDTAGNQSIFQSNAFNIDSTPSAPPTLTLTSPTYTNSTAVTFTAGSCGDVAAILINEGSQPAMGAAGWQTCTTSANAITYTLPTSEGPHTLRAWSKDSVGNVSTTSTNFTVTYDVTNPVLAITTPSIMRGGATYTLNWTLTEAYINNTRSFTVQYYNGSSWQSVGSVAATTGPHTTQGFSTSFTPPNLNITNARVRVSVNDLAGNSHLVQSGTFTIDSIAPNLTITSPSNNSYHLSSAVLTGACESGLNISFAGALQADFSVACSGSSYSQTINFSNGDGSKAIVVSQTDAAGNVTTRNITLIRDEVAPILTLNSGNNPDFTNQNTPNAWGGTCEGNYTITITGDQSTTINCSSGTWSWTPAAKTTDGTFSYSLVQTDAAGNTSSPPLTVSWERDATPPVFTMSTPVVVSANGTGNFTSNGNTVTLGGNCEGSNTIAITGTTTTNISCSASSWSWTTPSVSTDATRNYSFAQSDSAGNTTNLTFNWTRDTSGPALSLNDTIIKSNENTVTITGNCETGETINISGPQTASTTCPSGTFSWTSNSFGSDATRTFNVSQTFSAPPNNTTSASLQWIRETNIPTISSFTTTAPSTTTNAFVPASMNATSQNSQVALSHICFIRQTTTPPTANDSCWIGIDSPSVGLPLNQTLSLSNFSVLLGWATQAYTLHAYVKDEAGNISALTNSGNGTVNTDKITRTYDPGIAPEVFDVVAANVGSTSIPPSTAQSSVPTGNDVYIRWKVTDNAALPSNMISLFYTYDDKSYTAISTAQGIAPHTNHGCGIALDTNEGCYRWPGGSPNTNTYKIVVKATDTTALTTQATSNNLNSDVLKIIAGNTEQGVGGSAQTAIFVNEGTGDSMDMGTLVVTDNGEIYFIDPNRGILTVDPDNGKLVVFIPITGTATGDGGPAVNATLQSGIKITLDYQGRMLIHDDQRIRRVDLNQETPPIETIIGGGASTADTAAPLDVQFENMSNHGNEEDAMPFFAMPNGDIVFFSERPIKWQAENTPVRLRIYKAADNQVISKYYTGNVDSSGTQDLMNCRMSHFGLSFDSNSDFVHNVGFIQKATGWTGCDEVDGWRRALYDNDSFVAITPANDAHRWWQRYNYTGMDGNLYVAGYGGRVDIMNSDGSFTLVLGTGTRGECVDGTPATSCNVNIRSIFINSLGTLYFIDRGALRVVQDDGTIKTILGQKKTYGDGVLAVNGRFENIEEVTQLNDGRIVVVDGDGYYVKEFIREGNIDILAGTGTLSPTNPTSTGGDGKPIFGDPPSSTPGHFRSHIGVDRATGDLFTSRWSNDGKILKLDRSDTTAGPEGTYVEVIGSNLTGHQGYPDADGNIGDLVTGSTSSTQHKALIVGYDNNHLMVMRMRNNNTLNRYGTFRLKAYDSTINFTQKHVIGAGEYPTVGDSRDICKNLVPNIGNSTTNAANCEAPYWDSFTNIDFDTDDGVWYLASAIGGNNQAVYTYDMATTTFTYKAYVSADINDFYKVVNNPSGTKVLVYCTGGKLRRHNLDTNSDMNFLPWPIVNASCSGRKADYNAANHSLVFPIIQNGLGAVGEYFLPND